MAGSIFKKKGGNPPPKPTASHEASQQTIQKNKTRQHQKVLPDHKIILFGDLKKDGGDTYKFQFPQEDSPVVGERAGDIPVGFVSSLSIDNKTIFLKTRAGVESPEFCVCLDHEENLIQPWTTDLDALWIRTIKYLEKGKDIEPEFLERLDGDPLCLFGIASDVNQKALHSTKGEPVLRCVGNQPTIEDWFVYLNADYKTEQEYRWVVESFATAQLPDPWVSYKGSGSIVCFVSSETNSSTWTHPFYSYFEKLLHHCRQSTKEQHLKLRVNRLLWTYEAESSASTEEQQPLISPPWILQFAEIFNVDLRKEPFLVRTLKTFLKHFAHQFCYYKDVGEADISLCLEAIDVDRQRHDILLGIQDGSEETVNIDELTSGRVQCVECGACALMYCAECGDAFCEEDFKRLHERGNRRTHQGNRLIKCVMCGQQGAKLQCTHCFEHFCHACYAIRHVKELPKALDLRPRRIVYMPKSMQSDSGSGTHKHGSDSSTASESVWHTFYDIRGIRYSYNFETDEAMRHSSGPDESSSDINCSPRSSSSQGAHKCLPPLEPALASSMRIASTTGPKRLNLRLAPTSDDANRHLLQ